MPLDPELLSLLVCPQCRGPVTQSPDQAWLICHECRVRYEVRDDIPIMLPEKAAPLDQ